MDFEARETPDAIAAATDAALDEVPFGVVVMAPGGLVTRYNAFESRLSGLGPGDVIGRDFFVVVAPCTNNYLVREVYLGDDPVDRIIDYVFSYRMKPTRVRLRLIRPPEGPWLMLVQPR